MELEIVKKFRREEWEGWSDFRFRVFQGVQGILSELEEAWIEEEGGEEQTAGANEFYKFQVYTVDGKVRDVSIDLVFPDEATISVSKPREPTEEERKYFRELAEVYMVVDDFRF